MMKLTIFAVIIFFYSVINISAQTYKIGMTSAEKGKPEFRIAEKMATEIGNRLGVYFEVLSLPKKRATLLLNEGKIDGELARVKGYEEYVPGAIQVSEPIIVVPYHAYSATVNFKVNGWKSLVPYKIVYLRGATFVELNLKPIHSQLHPVNTPKAAFNFLAAKRADIFVIHPLGAVSILASDKIKNSEIKKLLPAVDVINAYSYFLGRHASLAKRYEEALVEMKKDGTHKMILTGKK